MSDALSDQPIVPFRIPPNIRLVRIDADRGLLPGRLTERIIVEAFRPGTEPVEAADSNSVSSDDVVDGSAVSISDVY
jgi:penicillin-binding protein 1A